MNLAELKESYPLFPVLASGVLLLLFLVIRSFLARSVVRRALLQNFDETRTRYIRKAMKTAVLVIFLVLMGIVWDISVKGLSVYIASFITVVGVGLFANWSIVSNITSSVILFFFFPLNIGSRVKIVDGDNSAEGIVQGISLFSIRIKKEDGNDIYYPNNLAIQKSIVHLRDRDKQEEPQEEVVE